LYHASCTTDCCGQLLNITNGRIGDIQRLRRLLIAIAGLLGTGLGALRHSLYGRQQLVNVIGICLLT
jgi:hypothetical protein